jgi:hypothetical protein
VRRERGAAHWRELQKWARIESMLKASGRRVVEGAGSSATFVHRKNGDQAMINSMSYKGCMASMVFDAEDKIIVGRILDIDASSPSMVSRFQSLSPTFIPPSKTIWLLP